ncbi:MAG: hypothetical protein PF961_04090 [Planctomycetota bacterium]|nr:hypothetical protein [Planctomycetota bacterium]
MGRHLTTRPEHLLLHAIGIHEAQPLRPGFNDDVAAAFNAVQGGVVAHGVAGTTFPAAEQGKGEN